MSAKLLVLVPALIGVLLLSACPKRTGAPTTAPSAVPAPAPAPGPEAEPEDSGTTTWKGMNRKQRINQMKTVVMPKMRAVFMAFDAQKYPKANCVTCHGPGAKRGKFEMPNPDLPKLVLAGGFAKHDKKWVKFMARKVVPAMLAALPGVPKFNPKTMKGFGCGSCHLFKK